MSATTEIKNRIVEAMASVDGWKLFASGSGMGNRINCGMTPLPDYLTSRDAAIGVIEKMPKDARGAFSRHLYGVLDTTYDGYMLAFHITTATALQLCVAWALAMGVITQEEAKMVLEDEK